MLFWQTHIASCNQSKIFMIGISSKNNKEEPILTFTIIIRTRLLTLQ